MAFNVDTPFSVIADWSWNEACKYAREAAVFLDEYATESLHWHGGCILLYRAGAKSVKEFSSFEVITCIRTNDNNGINELFIFFS